MAILNIFKKEEKKAEEQGPIKTEKAKKKNAQKTVKSSAGKNKPIKVKKAKKDIPEEMKEVPQEQPTDKTKQSVLASEFILRPHITEQSTFLAHQNVYTFRVSPSANKIIIKKAIKEMYGFEPVKINIINIPLKKRIIRGKVGIKSGYKKALVYLKEGDKIEFI